MAYLATAVFGHASDCCVALQKLSCELKVRLGRTKDSEIGMRLLLSAIVFCCACLTACSCQTRSDDRRNSSATSSDFGPAHFESLLRRVAEGWNEGDARKAADCFAVNAIYIEPPDRQLYRGREALYEFFGGSSGRASPMRMTWHHLLFDPIKQIGMGEYTFAYKGRETHGIVIVQIAEGKIRRWREYQYRSQMTWDDFVGESIF